jgi:hypothetical protein
MTLHMHNTCTNYTAKQRHLVKQKVGGKEKNHLFLKADTFKNIT